MPWLRLACTIGLWARLVAVAVVGAAPAAPAAAAGGPALVEDVPFITTPDGVTRAMLELAGVGRGDHLIDLGSGDGRIVITAARLHGASGLGVEIVPELVARSRRAAEQAGVADRVRFLEQDLFATDLQPATVITMYLLPEVNLQLRPRLLALRPGTRIVSHDWDMGDWQPDHALEMDVPEKTIGRDRRSRVLLWQVPAAVAGLWCGPAGQRLHVEQRFQQIHLSWPAPAGTPHTLVPRIQGRVQGDTLVAGDARQTWHGRAHWNAALSQTDRLQLWSAKATPDGPPEHGGLTWHRAAGGACP